MRFIELVNMLKEKYTKRQLLEEYMTSGTDNRQSAILVALGDYPL